MVKTLPRTNSAVLRTSEKTDAVRRVLIIEYFSTKRDDDMGFWSLLWGYWSTQTKTSVKAGQKCRLFGTFLSMLLSHYVYAFGKWIQQSSLRPNKISVVENDSSWGRLKYQGFADSSKDRRLHGTVSDGSSETLKDQLWKRKKQKERRKLSQEINTLSKVVIGKYQKAYNERYGSFNDFVQYRRSDHGVVGTSRNNWVHKSMFSEAKIFNL